MTKDPLDRTGRRLGVEAYEPGVQIDQWTPPSKYRACWQLLETVGLNYPQVLTDLEKYLDTFAGPPDIQNPTGVEWLREWVRRHRLHSDLVLKAAAFTVTAWRSDPEARAAHRWIAPDLVYERLPLLFTMPEFPEQIDRATWIALHDERTAQLKGAGWLPTVRRDPQQFVWLADLTVGRKSYSDIADAAGLKVQTVWSSLQELATFLDLNLPEPPTGRPRRRSGKSFHRI